MKKIKEELLKDAKLILLSIVFFLVFFKIIYLKENLFNVLKLVLSYYYLYLLPGYIFLIPFRKLYPAYKLVFGFGIGLALTNMLIYFCSFFINLSIYNTVYFVPLVLIVAGALCSYLLVKKGVSDAR